MQPDFCLWLIRWISYIYTNIFTSFLHSRQSEVQQKCFRWCEARLLSCERGSGPMKWRPDGWSPMSTSGCYSGLSNICTEMWCKQNTVIFNLERIQTPPPLMIFQPARVGIWGALNRFTWLSAVVQTSQVGNRVTEQTKSRTFSLLTVDKTERRFHVQQWLGHRDHLSFSFSFLPWADLIRLGSTPLQMETCAGRAEWPVLFRVSALTHFNLSCNHQQRWVFTQLFLVGSCLNGVSLTLNRWSALFTFWPWTLLILFTVQLGDLRNNKAVAAYCCWNIFTAWSVRKNCVVCVKSHTIFLYFLFVSVCVSLRKL